MAKQKGGSKKLRRSAKGKSYYEQFRRRHDHDLILRRGKREKQHDFFAANPREGSPSQIMMRRRVKNRKVKKKNEKTVETRKDI